VLSARLIARRRRPAAWRRVRTSNCACHRGESPVTHVAATPPIARPGGSACSANRPAGVGRSNCTPRRAGRDLRRTRPAQPLPLVDAESYSSWPVESGHPDLAMVRAAATTGRRSPSCTAADARPCLRSTTSARRGGRVDLLPRTSTGSPTYGLLAPRGPHRRVLLRTGPDDRRRRKALRRARALGSACTLSVSRRATISSRPSTRPRTPRRRAPGALRAHDARPTASG